MQQNTDAYQIIWLVRRLFRALAQRSNDILQDLGVSAADRAVMEFLQPEKQLSVPAIAEQYQVSRQHVQVTVNRLIEAGYLSSNTNPRHKRSSLIALTDKGKRLFQTIKVRDTKAVSALFSSISDTDMQTTRKTLEALLAELKIGDAT